MAPPGVARDAATPVCESQGTRLPCVSVMDEGVAAMLTYSLLAGSWAGAAYTEDMVLYKGQRKKDRQTKWRFGVSRDIQRCLVEAGPRLDDRACRANGATVATAIRLGTQRNVAREVRHIATRAIVAVGTLCDELDLTVDRGLGANGRGDRGVGCIDILAHVAENGRSRGAHLTEGDVALATAANRQPGDEVTVRVRNRGSGIEEIDVELVCRDLRGGGEYRRHLLYQGKRKKFPTTKE